MSSSDGINKQLQSIFENGRIEVGLEVGSDPGLSPQEYIQIPKSFSKSWAYCSVAEPSFKPRPTDSAEACSGKEGWTVVKPGQKRVRIHDGKYYAITLQDTDPEPMELFHRSPHTVDNIKEFIVANTGHVRDDHISVEQRNWVHSSRFWATVAGFVCGSKQREWVEVDTPTDLSAVSDQDAQAVVKDHGSALTASAARAASWRKSNHATGGEIAAGFPRRWLSKNNQWSTIADLATRKRAQKTATDAFYVATHASCVHPVLAMMAPSDPCHWAIVDPKFGMIMSWDILESTMIRISPTTQVAGTAIVVDSMVVLKMLVNEGLAPLLESASQCTALVQAYRQVEQNGIRAASYANWFLRGHPDNLSRVPFQQKDATFSALVGELAAVGRTFYRASTIGESLALENAMQQLATETAKNRWNLLTRARRSASNDTIMSVYTRIMGASASRSLALLSSQSQDDVRQGVSEYNNLSSNLAELVGSTQPIQVSVDRVIANMSMTPVSSPDDSTSTE